MQLTFENDEFDIDVLDMMKYHSKLSFSYDYFIDEIFNFIDSNLLHQIFKCFHNYIIEKFIYSLIEKHYDNNENLMNIRKKFDS